ncbi:MAG: M15 family metallopeptidase, partial [Fusobacterium mortiferum]
MYKFSKRSLNNLEGLHPKLQEFATELIKVTPYDISITCGVRTAEEQNKIYQQGRTIPGKIVTKCDGYKIKSKHQVKADGLGYAFDIAVIIDNKSNWNKKVFKDVADSA